MSNIKEFSAKLLKSPEITFCDYCKGKHYDPDNAKRQKQVRKAMKDSRFVELPHFCVANMQGKCLCQYAK